VSQTISALATLLWPLIVLAALVVFRRPLGRLIRSAESGYRVKVAGQELSVGELTDQQTTLVTDLQAQVVALRAQVEALRGAAAADPAPAAARAATGSTATAATGATTTTASTASAAATTAAAAVRAATAGRAGARGSVADVRVPRQSRTETVAAEVPSYPPPWERNQQVVEPECTPATPAEPTGKGAKKAPTGTNRNEGESPETGTSPVSRPAPAGVLWVDDQPRHNAVEMGRLQRNRVYVDTARSTAEALDKLSGQRYQLIISDLERKERGHAVPDAGLKLVRAVRALDPETPIVIYAATGDDGRPDGSAALAAGADVVTDSPLALYEEFRKHKLMG
jgi:CheY-like chemotaxis protein